MESNLQHKTMFSLSEALLLQSGPFLLRAIRVHKYGLHCLMKTAGPLMGDTASIDFEGRLTVTGRISGVINVAGRKVYSEKVEAFLLTSFKSSRCSRGAGAR